MTKINYKVLISCTSAIAISSAAVLGFLYYPFSDDQLVLLQEREAILSKVDSEIMVEVSRTEISDRLIINRIDESSDVTQSIETSATNLSRFGEMLDLNTRHDRIQRLEQLDHQLERDEERLLALMLEYNADLSDKSMEEKLSSALGNSTDYRANILEKFKLEKEIDSKK